jgi:hypothetical protein
MLTYADLVFGPQEVRLAQALVVDEFAVGTAQINDDNHIRMAVQLGVETRRRLVSDDDVIVRFPTEGRPARLQLILVRLTL